MKVLTAAEMREIDRQTIERGIPGLILMENAAHQLVDFLRETFVPLKEYDVIVFCGKGNNGGDGFAAARHLFMRRLCRRLTVIELFGPEELKGDAAINRRMLEASGCPIHRLIGDSPQFPQPQIGDSPSNSKPLFGDCPQNTLVLDAILGTGTSGNAKDVALTGIRTINQRYASAKVISVDIPSGLSSDSPTVEGELSSDSPTVEGEYVRADFTVTFTAPKKSQVIAPSHSRMGKLVVRSVGSPPELYDSNPNFRLHLTDPGDIRDLFAPRPVDSNKGQYGHVLVVGGAFGKSGAPAMAGLGSYRSGAGLVTVAVPKSTLLAVAAARPELMTEPLDETATGRVRSCEAPKLLRLMEKMTVLALGPGLGTEEETVRLVRELHAQAQVPVVVDADALNALAGHLPKLEPQKIRILTPHPGEMSRLAGVSTKAVQADRLQVTETFAAQFGVTLVLKGDRTVIAFPDGETWINPTGSPAMATGGTGDILTGMIAGLVAQHPSDWRRAVIAAVWLHGRCGELAAARLGEQSTLALDLLDSLPAAIQSLRIGDCPHSEARHYEG